MDNHVFQAENLRAIRKNLRYSFKEFSVKTNVSESQLKKIELGKTIQPNNMTINKISDFLNKEFCYASNQNIFPGFFYKRFNLDTELAEAVTGLSSVQANFEILEERSEKESIEKDFAIKLLRNYYDRTLIRFPYPHSFNDMICDPLTKRRIFACESSFFYDYYTKKFDAEKKEFSLLLSNLKEKYNMDEFEIQEIKRRADNIHLLENFLLYQPQGIAPYWTST